MRGFSPFDASQRLWDGGSGQRLSPAVQNLLPSPKGALEIWWGTWHLTDKSQPLYPLSLVSLAVLRPFHGFFSSVFSV